MKKTCGILAMLLGMTFTVAYAQKPAVVADNDPGWKRIGQVTASFKKQNESIAVLGADEFTAIKLKVSEAPINIDRVQVFYESGDMEELSVSKALQAGSETAVLHLSKPYRDIKKVAFTYKTLPNSQGDKADLELYGLKTNQQKHDDSYLDKKVDEADRNTDKAARETKQEVNRAKREAEEESEKAERKAERTENDLERAGENTGDEISEAAAKVMADIKDKRHQTKVGPGGQVVFIQDDGRYYYINNEGNKVYVTAIQLKHKPHKD